jgi:hypothetical protein
MLSLVKLHLVMCTIIGGYLFMYYIYVHYVNTSTIWLGAFSTYYEFLIFWLFYCSIFLSVMWHFSHVNISTSLFTTKVWKPKRILATNKVLKVKYEIRNHIHLKIKNHNTNNIDKKGSTFFYLQLFKTPIYGLGHGMIGDTHLDLLRCYIYFSNPLILSKHKFRGMYHEWV